VAHMGLVQPLTLPNGAKTRTIGFPVAISTLPPTKISPPPALGADNDAVIADWVEKH